MNNEKGYSSHSGWYFIFEQSPNPYWRRTSALIIGLPATQLLLITRKRVPPVGRKCLINHFLYLFLVARLYILLLLLCSSPRYQHNIPYTKIHGYCMKFHISPFLKNQ